MASRAPYRTEGGAGGLRPRPWLVVWTLCGRELVRFFRQRNRVLGAIGQPLLFWVLLGAGLGPSFRLPGAPGNQVTYHEYFFPGTLALILLFTAIFTTISIIEDRREGFLQSVLVAPIPRWSLVLGKLLGGTLIALVQGMVFLVLGLTLDLSFSPFALSAIVAFSFTLAFALTALGFVIAWGMDSVQGFHAIMSLVLLPMWLLSGAFFPADPRASAGSYWLAWVMRVNPLTYGVAGLRRLLYWDTGEGALAGDLPRLATCWAVTLAFAAVCFALAWHASGRRTTGDLL